MDEIELLIRSFRAEAGSASVARKLHILIELEGRQDERITPFLLEVLADDHEPGEVRIHALKRLRDGEIATNIRVRVADAITRILADESNADLRQRAALALGEFADVDGVLPALCGIALDTTAPIDLRYSAFTSLERAGPTAECVGLMQQLLADEALGHTARSALLAWHVIEE